MRLEGVVHDGVIVPDDAAALPDEGTRVVVTVEPTPALPAGETTERLMTFAEAFAEFRGAIRDAPADLAAQHDHYRLGVPKR